MDVQDFISNKNKSENHLSRTLGDGWEVFFIDRCLKIQVLEIKTMSIDSSSQFIWDRLAQGLKE
jgi:hypothetical protein